MKKSNLSHHKGHKFINPYASKRHKGMIHAFETFVIKGESVPNYRKTKNKVGLVQPQLHSSIGNKKGTKATWLGHSTVLLEINGCRVLTDPVFRNTLGPLNGVGPKRSHPITIKPKQCLPLDLVVISHNHYDHLEAYSIKQLRDEVKCWAVPLRVGRYLRSWGVPSERIIELDWWQSSKVNDSNINIHCTPAQHFSGRWLWDRDTSLWCSWVIDIGSFRVFFAGDSGYNSVQFKEIGEKFAPVDLGLIPIGVYSPRDFMEVVHVNSEESVKIHQEVGCRFSIGIHWGTFPLASEPIDEPPIKLRQAMLEARLKPEDFRALKIGESSILPKNKV